MATLIHGIAASENIDSSGERISIEGIDISSLEKDGVFNWEHKSDQPSQVVGTILKAKKIFSEKDCDNDHEKYFWGKIQTPFLYVMGELMDDYKDSAKEVAGNFRYDSDNKGKRPTNTMNFSIEGAKIEKKGIEITRSIARKVTLTVHPCNKAAIAEELKVKKKGDMDSLFKCEVEIELFKIDDKSKLFELLNKKEEPHTHAAKLGIEPMKKDAEALNSTTGPGALLSSEKMEKALPMASPVAHPGSTMGRTKSGKDVFTHQKIHDYKHFSSHDHREAAGMHHDAARAAKDPKSGAHHLNRMNMHMHAAGTAEHKEGRLGRALAQKRTKILSNIPKNPEQKSESAPPEGQKMEKALDAGSMMAAPGNLAGGAVLGKESLDKKPKKVSWLARAEEEYQKWEKREQYQSFMAKRMPHLTKGEIDAIGRTLALKKAVEAEKSLKKMVQSSFMPKGEIGKNSDIMMASEKNKK